MAAAGGHRRSYGHATVPTDPTQIITNQARGPIYNRGRLVSPASGITYTVNGQTYNSMADAQAAQQQFVQQLTQQQSALGAALKAGAYNPYNIAGGPTPRATTGALMGHGPVVNQSTNTIPVYTPPAGNRLTMASQSVGDITSNPIGGIYQAIQTGNATVVYNPARKSYNLVNNQNGQTLTGVSPVSGHPGVWQFNISNPSSEGSIQGVIGTDKNGTVQPFQDTSKQLNYTPGSPGGFFQNLPSWVAPVAGLGIGLLTGGLGSLAGDAIAGATGLTAGAGTTALGAGLVGAGVGAITGQNPLKTGLGAAAGSLIGSGVNNLASSSVPATSTVDTTSITNPVSTSTDSLTNQVNLGTAPLGTSTGGTSSLLNNVLPTNLANDAGATATVTPSVTGLPSVTVPPDVTAAITGSTGALPAVIAPTGTPSLNPSTPTATAPTPTTAGVANIPTPPDAVTPPVALANQTVTTPADISTSVNPPSTASTQATNGFNQGLQQAGVSPALTGTVAPVTATGQGIGVSTGAATCAAKNAGFNQALLNAGLSSTALTTAGQSPLNNSGLATTGSMAGDNVLGAGTAINPNSLLNGNTLQQQLANNAKALNNLRWLPTGATFIGSMKSGGEVMDEKRKILDNLIPELRSLLQGASVPHYCSGGTAQCSGNTLNTALSNLASQLGAAPDFAPVGSSSIPTYGPHKGATPLAPLHQMDPTLAPNWHWQPGCWALGDPTNVVPSMLAGAHLAKGGLPDKYKGAMPKDHNPEFITGLTGYYASGGGTGQSDDIPAMLHDGDYVIDAEAVSALGDGSSKAGKEVLDHFMHQVPHRDQAAGNPVPAKIADGEYVLPASFVTALGQGDNKRGAKMLDMMRQELREHKRSAPDSKIPPKAKSPLEYLKEAKR